MFLQKDIVVALLQGVDQRCCERLQWWQSLQGVGECWYKRLQCSQSLQRTSKPLLKNYCL